MTTIDSELVDNNEVGNACHGIVTPFRSFLRSKGCEETSENHDDISNDGNENVGTAQAAEKRKIQKQEWGGDTPVNVTGPVNFTVDNVVGVWKVLLRVLDLNLIHRDTVADGHGIIGDHGKGGDESSQDMEHAFLLD